MTRMVAAKTFLARMNEGRGEWLTEAQMLKACEEFFQSNGYSELDYHAAFEGPHNFISPVTGSNGKETIATVFRPKIDKYDMALFGMLESALFDIIDNREDTSLALVTDSLSYDHIMKAEEVGVAIENLMDEGMFLLFVNGRSAHALFDEFAKLSRPVPVSDD